MRKRELLERIEALEEKVRLLEIALELHEMTKHPAPVVPYWPFVPEVPMWPKCPYPGDIIYTDNTANGTTTTNALLDGDIVWLEARPIPPGPIRIYGLQ